MKQQSHGLIKIGMLLITLMILPIAGKILPTWSGFQEIEQPLLEAEDRFVAAFEPIQFYTVQIKLGAADQTSGMTLARALAAAGFPVVAWYPGKLTTNVEQLQLELGFTQDKESLTIWKNRLAAAGFGSELNKQEFPKSELTYNGRISVADLAKIENFNEQLRHLSRALDFFSHSWQQLKGQAVTEERLNILLKEGRQCEDNWQAYVNQYGIINPEADELLQQRLKAWIGQLETLANDGQEIQFWIAQQQAYALICQWQRWLSEIGLL